MLQQIDKNTEAILQRLEVVANVTPSLFEEEGEGGEEEKNLQKENKKR